MKKFILIHPEMGVYVGHALGMGFWSKLDDAGQVAAVTFDSEQKAKDHVTGWDCSDDLKNAVSFQSVETSEKYIHKSLLTRYW